MQPSFLGGWQASWARCPLTALWYTFPPATASPLSPQVLRPHIPQLLHPNTSWALVGSWFLPQTLQRPTLLNPEVEEGSVCHERRYWGLMACPSHFRDVNSRS